MAVFLKFKNRCKWYFRAFLWTKKKWDKMERQWGFEDSILNSREENLDLKEDLRFEYPLVEDLSSTSAFNRVLRIHRHTGLRLEDTYELHEAQLQ